MSPYKRVNATEQLQKIAQAVRINPEITVAELKELLGFAQEKSVYYWLGKTPYKGIREFRRAVLTGEYNPGYPFPSEHLSQSAEAAPRGVPLATTFTSQGKVKTHTGTVPIFAEFSDETFAYRLEDRGYFPIFVPGDLLIIDPKVKPSQGNFVLTLNQGKPKLYRYYPGKPAILIQPLVPNCVITIPKPKVTPIGPVVQLIRLFC